ncbi:MAG: hypothetical protein IPM57_06075 [Oligoflexia bacterium]|nr:hypothetical protein [Oligoflexia bacterium]
MPTKKKRVTSKRGKKAAPKASSKKLKFDFGGIEEIKNLKAYAQTSEE